MFGIEGSESSGVVCGLVFEEKQGFCLVPCLVQRLCCVVYETDVYKRICLVFDLSLHAYLNTLFMFFDC